jgi:succinyl-CoA synthetase beta subunit
MFEGGVHIVHNEQVEEIASKMIGQSLVTKQTGADGKPCDQVFVCEKFIIDRELYFAILLDRVSSQPVIVMSPVGGMSIEDLARE